LAWTEETGDTMLALLGSITINIDPVLVKVGQFSLRWYGLMYVVGIAFGLLVMFPYARRLGLKDDAVWNIFWGTAIAALVGGRLYYILQSDPGSYLKNPGDILAFWQGGMAYFGAIFLGVPVLLLLARQQGVPLGLALDCVAILAPLAQALGRIGNIINGDVVGYPSGMPWATVYTNVHTFAPLNQAVQPAGAYELLFSLGLFVVLWPLRFRLHPAGLLFILYLSLPPLLGIRIEADEAAILGLALNFGGYATEILRAGIEAVPHGQTEAATALGLRPLRIFRHVILFPALRVSYPALASQFILILLGSSVVSAISAEELTATVNTLQSTTFRSFEFYFAATLIYLGLAAGARLALDGLFWAGFVRGRPAQRLTT